MKSMIRHLAAAAGLWSLSVLPLPAEVVTATFNSATTVPVTAAGYTAAGNTVDISLGFTPPVGTDLMLVNNTSLAYIDGEFGNLAHGQRISLSRGGVNYPFVADYFGGSGNDLVLRWRFQGLVAWGSNSSGQLGNGASDDLNAPVPVDPGGILADKTVRVLGTGNAHSVALTVDGTLLAWGSNGNGRLGNNSAENSSVPVPVDQGGVLAGKLVIGLAVGTSHTLALCSDGTVVAWGFNSNGQLGNGSTASSGVPVAVNQTGVLAGKQVIAVAAGSDCSFAICSDGSAAAWGANVWKQLGITGSLYSSSNPQLVDRTSGALEGKSITAVAVGYNQTLFLCADGTLAACGTNTSGGLGNNSTVTSATPVLVSRAGVLSGKTVTAIAAGTASYALCSDGTLAAWGYNTNGQLGNGNTNNSTIPVLVSKTGGLSGKTVTAITAGFYQGLAQCSDGSLAAWGGNPNGQLGNNSNVNSTTPVVVNTTQPKLGERAIAVRSGPQALHNLAVMAWRTPPSASTLAATGLRSVGATLAGRVNANGTNTSVKFQYGLTTAYGHTISAVPATLSGTAETSVGAILEGLSPGTSYHFRVLADNGVATISGEDLTFTTGTQAALAELGFSAGTLTPAFDFKQTNYLATVPHDTSSVRLTPVCLDPAASVTVSGVAVPSGSVSDPLSLPVGSTVIPVVVTAADGIDTMTYTVTVTRLPAALVFTSATSVPVTANGFVATGLAAVLELGFAPTPGTALTVVKNTSPSFIQGTFDNLDQGQIVQLTHGGVIYTFAANYFGGSGNDLVLQWATHRLAAWGRNSEGQLGNGGVGQLAGGNTVVLAPVPVDASGILAGKTILAGSAGSGRSLVLCSDGTLAAWGSSSIGSAETSSSNVPVAVDQSGVLAGKTVIAVACGNNHSLALCSDGTLASWGINTNGQLGTGNTTASSVPVMVSRSGVLAGKDIVAIGAGSSFSIALCSDGSLAAWGGNGFGQLGDNSTTQRTLPVLVNTSGLLAGKTPVAIAVGSAHCLALCSDGTLAAWGLNSSGELGINSTTQSSVPVLVTRSGTVLLGKTVVALSAGGASSHALCSDGTMAVWGANGFGQLGVGNTTNRLTAVSVDRSAVLSGRTITFIAGGRIACRVHCSDGSVVTWGYNGDGQLGNNSTTNSAFPVLVNSGILKPGERFVDGFPNSSADHHIALIASPPAAIATSMAATSVTDSGAVLNGSVNPNLTSVTVAFEYGPTHTYGNTINATPSVLSGNTATAVTANLSGLLPGTAYHFRLITTSAGGMAYGADQTFTTTTFSTLSGLTMDSGLIAPSFSSLNQTYQGSVPFATDQIRVTPTATHAGATVSVNGIAVESGDASGAIPLNVGANLISVVVNAEDGINTKTYTINVTRLPEVFRFNSASTVPVSVGDFEATGFTAEFELNFAPVPGTTLTAVKNTGIGPIRGTLSNLTHGQIVRMTYQGISYAFAASYFGGSGNDLVLHWANTRLLGWGLNTSHQLATGSTATNRQVPTPVNTTGVLAGKTVIAMASTQSNSVAVCADGTLATWGSVSAAPVLVDTSGVLNGKTPVAVAAGTNHFLALCSDGTLAAWGTNTYGQFGNDSTTSSTVPVAVDQSGVLAGKFPVAIAAGEWFSLALCSDGTLAAWGSNNHGRLGDNTTTQRRVPVQVNTTTALAGKTVVAIACGAQHSLALCSDGTMATWGNNPEGQLGNNTTTLSYLPVSVNTPGILAAKSIIAIDAGQNHNLILCSDGALFAWGENNGGQLGNNSTTNSSVPVAVLQSGALNGKTVTSITSGLRHNLALCSDGTLVSWGINNFGTLGDNSLIQRNAPVLVFSAGLGSGERFVSAFTDGLAFHCFAVVARPPPPTVATMAASSVEAAGAVLNATVNAAGATTTLSFDYGPTTDYGSTISAAPGSVTGTSTTAVSAAVGGLIPGLTYHFRVRASSANGTSLGADMTFIAGSAPVFSGYVISTPFGKQAVVSAAKLLAKASDPDGEAILVAAVGPASANGGSVTLGAGSILYTPPAGFSGADIFPVIISDAGGATTTGSVTVNVGPAPTAGGQTANPPKLTLLTDGGMEIRFHGIPGRSYQIQRSTDLSSWSTITTVTANSTGGMVFIDAGPPKPSAYYRLALP
jgi:alpha-tubulin suppressor-like RCC1 family protein